MLQITLLLNDSRFYDMSIIRKWNVVTQAHLCKHDFLQLNIYWAMAVAISLPSTQFMQ